MTAASVRRFSVGVYNPLAALPSIEGQLKTLTSADGLNETLDDVAPVPYPAGTFVSGLSAWSNSVIINSGTHGKIYYTNGGHGDSVDNSVYCYDIGTRKWTRCYGPAADLVPNASDFSFEANGVYGLYADGSPVASHGYDMVQGAPPTIAFPEGRLLWVGRHTWVGSTWTAERGNYAVAYDPATNTWTRGPNSLANLQLAYMSAVWLPDLQKFMRFGQASGDQYYGLLDPYTLTWDSIYTFTDYAYRDISYDFVSGYCPLNKMVVSRNTYSSYNTIEGFDYQTGRRAVLTTVGTGPTKTDPTGKEWCPLNNRFYCYKLGSNYVWTLTPPDGDPFTGNWSWALETFDASSDTAFIPAVVNFTTNQRNNLWRWSDKAGRFFVYGRYDQPVQSYKPRTS